MLNGTSSAGKSATARALQQIMETPYVHTGIEHFLPRVPQRFFGVWEGLDPPPVDYFMLVYKGAAPRMVVELEGGEAAFGLGDFAGVRIGPEGIKLLAGVYRGIAALAAAGVDVIVDDVLYDERLLRAAVDAFCDLPVLFVGLHVPREVAEQRERERGDRGPGGAAAFYDLVHAHGIYDLELETSILSPQECALRIREAVLSGSPHEAFRRLRALFAA
jgi:chloramphenicol 3-O phosphotransferase